MLRPSRLAALIAVVVLVGVLLVASSSISGRARRDAQAEALRVAAQSASLAQLELQARRHDLEARTTAGASLNPVRALVANRVDDHTVRDSFETEEWWRSVREDFPVQLFVLGSERYDFGHREQARALRPESIVREAVKHSSASGVLAAGDTAWLAAAAIVDVPSDPSRHPAVVVLAQPLGAADLVRLAFRAGGAVALTGADRRVLVAGGAADQLQRLRELLARPQPVSEDGTAAAGQVPVEEGLLLWAYADTRGVGEAARRWAEGVTAVLWILGMLAGAGLLWGALGRPRAERTLVEGRPSEASRSSEDRDTLRPLVPPTSTASAQQPPLVVPPATASAQQPPPVAPPATVSAQQPPWAAAPVSVSAQQPPAVQAASSLVPGPPQPIGVSSTTVPRHPSPTAAASIPPAFATPSTPLARPSSSLSPVSGQSLADSQAELTRFGPIPFGRYRLLRVLGQGRMGTVHLAIAHGENGFRRFFVVKRLREQVARTPEALHQFINEARLGASVVHSNIVPVYDFGRVGDEYFFAQEYILGRDLNALVRRSLQQDGRPLPLPVVFHIGWELLEALSYAHSRTDPSGAPLGIVHRDISPTNIMVSARGEVKLLDFGIAKSERRPGTPTQGRTITGNSLFMSPEQARGGETDSRSDLFSLGLTLYYCLTGETLYDHDISEHDLVVRAAHGPGPAERGRIARLSSPADLLASALQVDPADRFQTADEFRLALHASDLAAGAAALPPLVQRLLGAELAREQARLMEIEQGEPPEPTTGTDQNTGPGTTWADFNVASTELIR